MKAPQEKLICDSHVTVVRCLEVEPEFIRIWLRSDHVYGVIESKATGATNQVELTAQMTTNQAVPLPPLAEQYRIVAKVDELMGLCDRLQSAQQNRESQRDRLVAASLHHLNQSADGDRARFYFNHLSELTVRSEHIKALRQTILNLAVRGKLISQDSNDDSVEELFKRVSVENQKVELNQLEEDILFEIPKNWVWLNLHQLFEVSGGIQKTPGRTPKDNAFPYLGVGNVYRGYLDLKVVNQFELKDEELNRKRLEPGDILVVEGNGSFTEIGRCAIWHGEIENCVHQNHVIRCRPVDASLSPFTLIFLNSPIGIEIMQRLAITSSVLFSLSVGKIRKIAIPLPPLAEQHRIVAKVDELMGLCDRLETQLSTTQANSRRLLKSLLYEALTPSI